MPFIPHTEAETKAMLEAIGASSMSDLYSEVPDAIKIDTLDVPEGLSEMAACRFFQEKAQQNKSQLCFIGGGAYEHHIPAAIWDIAARGEFYTAYTPYQAEVSQGTLQLLYEFQSMMCHLTGMEVSNASLYEGATAVVEAVRMLLRSRKKQAQHLVLIPQTLNPLYQETLSSLLGKQPGLIIKTVPMGETGAIDTQQLDSILAQETAPLTALVIAQPNFLGCLESVDALTDWTHQNGGEVIAQVNPLSLALLKPPGQWGELGADITCGEAQPLGIPLSGGGPYLGFICAKQRLVRQMPGRIIGRTHDDAGREGFCLTLQAREQHIRRSKATSNICTSQGLLVVAATIYMSLLGAKGMKAVATSSHQGAEQLKKQLLQLNGVEQAFSGHTFHEFALKLPVPVNTVLEKLSEKGIQGGIDLGAYSDAWKGCLLSCVTETKTQSDIDAFEKGLTEVLEELC